MTDPSAWLGALVAWAAAHPSLLLLVAAALPLGCVLLAGLAGGRALGNTLAGQLYGVRPDDVGTALTVWFIMQAHAWLIGVSPLA